MATKKKARKDETEEAAAAAAPRKPSTKRKRKSKSKSKSKRGSSAAAASTTICNDDVLRSIFARLPVRSLVASMTLSKHHRRMILSPEFRSLCCRLGPPLPAPQIAYIATEKISSRCRQRTVSAFHSFHVADAAGPSSCNAPTRSLIGPRYIDMEYVNTCNGVLLFDGSQRCVLWNPCVANSDKEVAIPGWKHYNGDRVLGFGYGRRSQTYKLLVSRKCEGDSSPRRRSHREYPKDLLVYSLRDTGEQMRLRMMLPGRQEGEGFFYQPYNYSQEIVLNSIYIDGIIYLLHVPKRVVFAFDVDHHQLTREGPHT
ncbi:hypothetical protein PVAP13_9KG632401 [Panicum virgatum]|uniref:F-box domain-containing protein n=1 Tax=Panicum virgatum TaxID=38727 RepID=A0A8T0NWL8_PANVG|nr:hypothetical protein PVAP13_9KG632401 [Panicum virgatum]